MKEKLITDKNKCSCCGGCVAVCPKNAIRFLDQTTKQEIPILKHGRPRTDEQPIMVWDVDKCDHCGNCIRGCPLELLSFKT